MIELNSSVNLKRTFPSHFSDFDQKVQNSSKLESQFVNSFFNILDQVNAKQIQAEELQQKMVEDPSSIEAHTVSIAMAKAQTAVKLTTTVINKLTEGLTTLENLR